MQTKGDERIIRVIKWHSLILFCESEENCGCTFAQEHFTLTRRGSQTESEINLADYQTFTADTIWIGQRLMENLRLRVPTDPVEISREQTDNVRLVNFAWTIQQFLRRALIAFLKPSS